MDHEDEPPKQQRKRYGHRRRRPNPPPRLEWPAGGGIGASLTTLSSSPSEEGPAGSSSIDDSGRRKGIGPLSDAGRHTAETLSSSSAATIHPASQRRTAASSEQTCREGPGFAVGRGGGRDAALPRSVGGSRKKGKRGGAAVGQSSLSMLWVDKYAPTTDAAELCVAPKKVKEVRGWIESSIRRETIRPVPQGVTQGGGSVGDSLGASGSSGEGGKLLVLVGSPGVGKSTTIRVLASELGLSVQQWNDAHQNSFVGSNGYGGDSSILSLPYQSQLASFEEFLQCAGAGFSALDVAGSRSTLEGKGNDPKRAQGLHAGGLSSSLIMIEEVPNLHSPESAEKFRSIMGRHIRQSAIPTILIFSDVCEGKHKPDDLERLIDPSILYSPLARIAQVHSVTKSKMKKCLNSIAKQEGLNSLSSEYFDEIHLSSGGDLRHAIMALQFGSASGGRRRVKVGNAKGGDRDTKLSTFHALGKLMYAKRKKDFSGGRQSEHGTLSHCMNMSVTARPVSFGRWDDGRAPLDFKPENVMNESDIGRGGALSFLHFHSPDFFTDETELSRAFDGFSDAAMFLDRSIGSQRDHSEAVFPLEYVSSLGGRAVADANKHPAPNRFRQFSAPKVFEVMRKKRANDVKMLHLCKRLSVGSQHLPLRSNIGSSQLFVTDSLPFMRAILPDEVGFALANLHSYVRESDANKKEAEPSLKDEMLQVAFEEQQQILGEDDIIDDDSSDNEVQNVSVEISEPVSTVSPVSALEALPLNEDSHRKANAQADHEVIVIDC